MERIKAWILEYRIVLLFALAKLVVHLVTATNYGFQRDAYLYLAQSRHLDWGFFSTPPLVAFVTRIHTMVWGDSLLAVRLLPALIGVTCLFLVGWLIKQLKGGTLAQMIGLTAYLLSPGFLRPAVLLQPVIFNHLFWLLAAVVVFQLVRKQDSKMQLWLIPALGLGWLAKYSIIFYGSALLVALVISRHRKLLWSWYLLVTLAGGMLLILPNLVWQFQHNWPVISHMNELQETQLGNVLLKDFLVAQLLIHLPAVPVWLGGLAWLIFNKKHRNFRLFAWAFLLTLLLIILLRGKFYYTIAAYTMLIVFGALAWEHWAARPRRYIAYLLFLLIFSNGIFALPFSLPVYAPERMIKYDQSIIKMGLDVMLTWEDGEIHDLPQDYADMVGWDELGAKVWEFYDSLNDTVKAGTLVYGEFYGCAASMDYFRPDKSYPEVYSFNDAFTEWVPRAPELTHMIYVGYSDRVPDYFEETLLVGRVEHPQFREHGLPIWFGSLPTSKLYADWEESWQENVAPFIREKRE
ncbi:MAG: glycosyltransferase family 39 protein [Bacteroidales bacterium]|nr:glycosyltransferase family 39 protein [Bacteroidales bacterium]